jgi:signal transduction histidine kinase
VRRISHDLDSGLLSRFGFKTAMLQLVQLLESTNKLKVMYIDNGIEPALYKPFETDLYRITQELLSNAIKYAEAKEISIQLTLNNGNLVYSYEDDGVGFEKEKLEINKGIGYQNINTRVKK